MEGMHSYHFIVVMAVSNPGRSLPTGLCNFLATRAIAILAVVQTYLMLDPRTGLFT